MDFDAVSEVASYITPVPGGVGKMTISMLMENTLEAACRKRAKRKELNEYVRKLLAGDPMLRGIAARRGQQLQTAHFRPLVFSLKDEKPHCLCDVPAAQPAAAFVPRDGMRVVLMGSVGLYTASGSYQFYAEGAMQEGVGDLYQRFLAQRR